MENMTTTVEMDNSHFDDLKNQMIVSKERKTIIPQEATKPELSQSLSTAKKYTFVKGDKSFDVDDDAEIEFMADKKPMKLTLRELKDRAAGEIAVKNRMHALAEEKKRVQSTIKQFAELSKEDPLAALEYISKKANEADSEFEYDKYLQKLADQAEKLGQMDEKERKSWELEKKLSKAEQDLSLKEREALAVRRKQEILGVYPEIGDQQFGQMVDAILSNDELLEGVETENDVLDKVEDLIVETLTQRDIMKVINDINPQYLKDDNLIFNLSDQIRQNPDLDEEDIRDIIREIISPSQKRSYDSSDVRSNRQDQRLNDAQVLSRKQIQGTPVQHLKNQGGTDFDVLRIQLLEQKEKNKRTPLYMR